ncbi:MAG: OmpA family protein [Rhodospirillales bacterium]|nr:OmpA family protein [Rhodospirillales bacterium]
MSEQDHGKDKASEIQMPMTGKRFHRRTGDIHGQEESSHIWLISFTDVMALMLTFFVLLFSMTEPAKQDWSEITSAMQAEFNKFYGSLHSRGPQDSINIARVNFNQALNIRYLEALLESVIGENELLENVSMIPQAGHLIVSLPRELLFDAGSADVREEGKRALYALGGSLARIKNKIEVTGHADPRVITASDGSFESNWELSLVRAANVAALLESVGYEREITVRGHSSGRYEDLYGIADEQQRLDLSRRVDIIILDHDGSKEKVFFDPAAN